MHNPFDVKARKLPQDRRAELRSRYMEGDETLTVSSKAKAAIALARDANAVSKLLPPKGPLGYTYFDLKTADDKIQEELLAKNKGKQSKSIHERVDRADKKMKSIALKNASCTCCMTSIGVSKYVSLSPRTRTSALSRRGRALAPAKVHGMLQFALLLRGLHRWPHRARNRP